MAHSRQQVLNKFHLLELCPVVEVTNAGFPFFLEVWGRITSARVFAHNYCCTLSLKHNTKLLVSCCWELCSKLWYSCLRHVKSDKPKFVQGLSFHAPRLSFHITGNNSGTDVTDSHSCIRTQDCLSPTMDIHADGRFWSLWSGTRGSANLLRSARQHFPNVPSTQTSSRLENVEMFHTSRADAIHSHKGEGKLENGGCFVCGQRKQWYNGRLYASVKNTGRNVCQTWFSTAVWHLVMCANKFFFFFFR